MNPASTSNPPTPTTAVTDCGGATAEPCTPDTKQQNRFTMVVRNLPSAMSSSLKERLKKCGRYHPATPPSGRPTPASASLYSRPGSTSDSDATSSPSCQQHHTPSPSSARPLPSNSLLSSSPCRTKKTLPQPRNILMDKSILNSPLKDSDSSSQSQTGHKACMDISEHNTDCDSTRGQTYMDIPDHNKDCDMDSSIGRTCAGAEYSCSQSQSDASTVITTTAPCLTDTTNRQPPTPVLHQNKFLCTPTKEARVLETSSVASGVNLRETKRQLSANLAERKELLRKLHMVKTYRAKHDLQQLEALISKWRSASQQAVLDLHHLTPDPRPSLTQLVQQLGIDQELVRYNQDDECFDDN